MHLPISFCRICKHYRNDATYTCKAFPFGIPVEILMGDKQHFLPYLNDNNYQFELLSDKWYWKFLVNRFK